MGDILEMKEITKIFFGGVVANEGINFTLRKGEVHSILGENGAGKSALMNILAGVLHPTAGEIFLNNEKVLFGLFSSIGGLADERIIINAKEEYPIKIAVRPTSTVFHNTLFFLTVYLIPIIIAAIKAIK